MDAGKKRIWVRGQFVEVTDEVYTAYMQGDRKMRYFEEDLKSAKIATPAPSARDLSTTLPAF